MNTSSILVPMLAISCIELGASKGTRGSLFKEGAMPKPEPSALIRKFGSKIAAAALEKPILDVACGSGRNALHLLSFGCTVICMDRDLSGLERQLTTATNEPSLGALKRLVLHQIDLQNDAWPFEPQTIGGVINVHFTLRSLFPHFRNSLVPNGYLLLETVPGCGGNYLDLPRKGELKATFKGSFSLEMYKETPVGPSGRNAVTVKLLARRRD